jgi:tetratricopeptide (TPR) repeat protein
VITEKRLLWIPIILVVLVDIIIASIFFIKEEVIKENILIKLFVITFVILQFIIVLYLRFSEIFLLDKKRQFREQTSKILSSKKKHFKDAIKSGDIETLWSIALDYKDKWLLNEYLDTLKQIIRIDQNGEYGKRAKEALSKFEQVNIDKQMFKEIERLSAKIINNQNDFEAWIGLADVHAKAGLYEDAVEAYKFVLKSSANDELKELARNKIEALQSGKRGVRSTPLTKNKE